MVFLPSSLPQILITERPCTEVNEAVHVHVASRDGKGYIEEYDDVMVAERGEGEIVEYGPYESVQHVERIWILHTTRHTQGL